jgi:protein-S-isoprenylcysteine O-methyltransferase Ste14
MISSARLRNSLSALAFLVAVAALVFLIAIHQLLATTPLLIAIQVAAVLLMIWARVTFGWRSFHATAGTSKGGLVTTGPYRYWRHPIYASIVYFVWAGQIPSSSPLALAAATCVTLALLGRMLLEEQFLRESYPDYDDYCRQAKRFIPFVV